MVSYWDRSAYFLRFWGIATLILPPCSVVIVKIINITKIIKSICDHEQNEQKPYFVLQSLSWLKDKLPNGEHLIKSIIRQINDIIGDPVVVIDTILK